jgi:2-oxoglutarate ferredoxin oxidoreductase subunit delta
MVDGNVEIVINRKWCKACGLCIAFCPKGVLEADQSGKPVINEKSDCSRCKNCEYRCPDSAITFA